MNQPQKIKVSKLDAARRQLDSAIQLWFSSGDPVAIHTLVCAAYQVIQDIGDKNGDRSFHLVEVIRARVSPERLEEAMNLIKKPQMFFKHANRDPYAILEFDPLMSEALMYFSIFALKSLGEQIGDYQTAFLNWLVFHKPSFFVTSDELLEKLAPVDQLKECRSLDKRDFLKASLLAIAQT